MDESGQLPLALGLDGHDEAVGADGHDRLLQDLRVGRRGDDLLQGLADLRALLADLAADGGKLAAGRIRDLVFGEDGVENAFFEVFIARDLLKIQIKDRSFLCALALGIALRLPRGTQHAGDPQQFLRAEAAAAVRAVERRADVIQPAERRRALDRDAFAGRARLFQQVPDLIRVRRRADGHAAVLRRLRGGVVGKQREDLVQLELAQGFFILFVHKRFLFFRLPSGSGGAFYSTRSDL